MVVGLLDQPGEQKQQGSYITCGQNREIINTVLSVAYLVHHFQNKSFNWSRLNLKTIFRHYLSKLLYNTNKLNNHKNNLAI